MAPALGNALMALVVLLRGVNVGGHRTFRPSELARQLKHLGAVNIGAAGTLVIRQPVTRTQLRAELARRVPFEAGVAICDGRELLELTSEEPFAEPVDADVVRFVSVLFRRPRSTPPLPMRFPERGPWLLKVVGRQDRFVLGLYRRRMRAISYLGTLDRIFGVPLTTRNWNTISAIVRALGEKGS